MGIWVVVLEAAATEGDFDTLVDLDDLDALAEELAAQYAVVTSRPGAYQAELWVEEGTAGGAILAALRLWQGAVRYIGLPGWDVARAEARDARALELGVIDWPTPPDAVEEEPAPMLELEPPNKAAAKKKAAKKKAAATKRPAARTG